MECSLFCLSQEGKFVFLVFRLLAELLLKLFSDAWRIGFQMALLHKTCHEKVHGEVIVSESTFTRLCRSLFKNDDFDQHSKWFEQ